MRRQVEPDKREEGTKGGEESPLLSSFPCESNKPDFEHLAQLGRNLIQNTIGDIHVAVLDAGNRGLGLIDFFSELPLRQSLEA
jgi:hypothetical protein